MALMLCHHRQLGANNHSVEPIFTEVQECVDVGCIVMVYKHPVQVIGSLILHLRIVPESKP